MEITSEQEILVTEAFQPFLTNQPPIYRIDLIEEDNLDAIPQDVIYHGDCFEVRSAFPEIRSFFNYASDNRTYAAGRYDWDKKCVCIEYLKEGLQYLNETGNVFYHIGMEAMLLQEGRMILHSCLVNTKSGAILFSGNSGIGKSTQGNLWCTYENGRVINGDRSIIYKRDSKWVASGSPYAGSSRVYVNEAVPIRAIVMLGQDKTCSIRRLNASEAFRSVYRQTTMNDWNMQFVNKVCDFLNELVSELPVYELRCTPDRDAVDLLKDTLEKEKPHEQ